MVRAFGGTVPSDAEVISPENAGWRIDEWFSEEGGSRQALVEIADAIGGALVHRPQVVGPSLRTAVREAFQRGLLKAYKVRLKLSGAAVQKAPELPDEPERPVEKKTFILIELVDDSDPPKPVPYKRYRIELPDHSVREGMLDANGQAKVTGIDPGTCKVSFPQIHGDDWKLA